MNKIALITILTALLVSCAPPKDDETRNPDSTPTGGGGAFSECAGIPETPTPTATNCPGVIGTWNNFQFRTDVSGNVLSFTVNCGESVDDRPPGQITYDVQMVPPGYTSNEDFRNGTDCSSGSSSNSAGTTIRNVWRLVQ